MNNLWIVIFFLMPLSTIGQTEIHEINFNLEYYYECIHVNYDITIPLLNATGQDDIRRHISDSLITMFNNITSEFNSNYIIEFKPNSRDEHDCFEMIRSDEIRKFGYFVKLNTDRFLSIVIHYNEIWGRNGILFPILYNIDLSNNKFITIDSLFSSTNKEKVLKLIKVEFDHTQNFTYAYLSNKGEISYRGISISDKGLTVYYDNHRFPFITIELPWTDIKDYVDKKYLKLLNINEK